MARRQLLGIVLLTASLALLLAACGAPVPAPSATPTGTQDTAVGFATPPPSPTASATATMPPATATVAPTQAPVPATPPPAKTATPASGVAATGEIGSGSPAEVPTAVKPAAPTPVPAPPRTDKTRRVIALDPGHGGPESGASAYGLVEKDVNLKIALKAAALLRAEGYDVVLTRDTDRATSPLYTGGGYGGGLTYDVQARVDIANAAGADLFFSIHNNGSGDPTQSGTEVWYNLDRPFSDRNVALAQLLQQSLLKRIRALGYPAVDRGIKDDSNFRIFRGRSYNLYVLGPGTGARPHEPTHMPGVLGESLFISHAGDAAILAQERGLDAVAAGYRDAVLAYFARFPD